MKRICAILCVLCITGLCSTGHGQPSSGIASDLAISVAVTRERFAIGQPVLLEITFRNIGRQPISVMLSESSAAIALGQPLAITITDLTGRAIGLSTIRYSAVRQLLVTKVIEPGKSLVVPYDLQELIGYYISPGEYNVVAEYRAPELVAKSNRAVFTVAISKGEDEKALHLYRIALKAGERSIAIETLETLIAKYPTSDIMARAEVALAQELYAVGQRARAADLWSKGLEQLPGVQASVRMRLAWYLKDTGKVTSAIAVLAPVETEYAAKLRDRWKKEAATQPSSGPSTEADSQPMKLQGVVSTSPAESGVSGRGNARNEPVVSNSLANKSVFRRASVWWPWAVLALIVMLLVGIYAYGQRIRMDSHNMLP